MGNWTRRFSLRWFGTILLLSTLTLLLGCASWMSYRVVRGTLWVSGLRSMDFQVMSTLGMVKGRVVTDISQREFMKLIHSPVQVDENWRELAPALSSGIYHVQLLDQQGRLVDNYPPGSPPFEPDPQRLEQLRRWQPGSRLPARVSYQSSTDRQVLMIPLTRAGQPVGFAIMASTWFPAEGFLTSFAAATGVVTLVILSVILLVYLALVRQITAPLSALTDCARRVSAGDLQARTGLAEGRNEIYLVGAAFDQMLERLSRLFQTQKNFVADVSHELRTPLTALTGQLHILQSLSTPDDHPRRQQALDRAERDLDRMTALVQDLLTLMRSEDAPLARVEFALQPWLEECAERLRELYPDRELQVAEVPLLRLWAEREGLARALDNVLVNACKYTPPESPVWLRVERCHDQLRISVQDQGPGLSAEALAHLGERFYRPDPSRSRQTGGSGLGLAITRATLERHGGALEVSSLEGSGTTVTLTLPLEQA